MLVRADHTLGFDPKDVAEDVVPDVEREVAYGRVGAKRHPRAFLLRGPDEGSRHGVPFDHVPLQLGDIDDLVSRGRRRRHGLGVRARPLGSRFWRSLSSHVHPSRVAPSGARTRTAPALRGSNAGSIDVHSTLQCARLTLSEAYHMRGGLK